MRGLFDTKKEQKSIKLVKKLQEEADKEWQKEVTRRKEQELNDEVIAKELQAQLEEEQRQASRSSLPGTPVTRNDNTNPFLSPSSPPPLPTKPRAYNSANNIIESSSNKANVSTNSAPTKRNSFPIKPLYGLSNTSSSSSSLQPSLPPRQYQEDKKPVKSYLNSTKRYQPELQFSVASPIPEKSSVFYSKTPVISNSAPPPTINGHAFTSNAPSNPIVMQPVRPTVTSPPPTETNANTSEPVRNHMSMPVPTDVSPYKPVATNTNSSAVPSSSSSNIRPPATNVTSHSTPPTPYSSQKSDPIVLPLSQQHHYHQTPPVPVAPPAASTPSHNNTHHLNHNESLAYFQNSNNYDTNSPVTSKMAIHTPAITASTATTTAATTAPYYHQQVRHQDNASPSASLPLNPNNIVQNASSYPNQHYQQQQSYPPKPPITTSACNNGFQLPPMPVFESSYGNSAKQPTSMPLNKQDQHQHHLPHNNINSSLDKKKPLFSNSVLMLKPDEEQTQQNVTEQEEEDDDDWDNEPVSTSTIRNRVPTSNHMHSTSDSDDESEVDYSDMIYDRRDDSEKEIGPKEAKKEAESEAESEDGSDADDDDDDETWVDPAVDPFADSFSVSLHKASTATSTTLADDTKSRTETDPSLSSSIQILDPTLAAPSSISQKRSKEDKVAEETEERPAVTNGPHQYEEKESTEIEVRPPAHGISQSSLSGFLRPDMATPGPVYRHQNQTSSQATFYTQSQQQVPVDPFDSLSEEEQLKVYPTNILKAGAPPIMSTHNTYNKIQQQGVPTLDYGYYKDGNDPLSSKSLPNLPSSNTKGPVKDEEQDRHITVASINPDQRVWIRIHPTDTGKVLAERIHIVASYQTRRVTKITTKNGRNIALDNSPLFEDWNEILNFKEGEAWTVDWVPVESPYVDIITDTKEFMKQLKANFRGASSSSAAAS